jgi:nitrous oxidase accessory protein
MRRGVSVTVAWLLAGVLIQAVDAYLVKGPPTTIQVPDDYSTIQAAITAAQPGDTVLVHEGAYQEHLVVDKPLTLRGQQRSVTIIDGQGTGTTITVQANDVSISDLTLQNAGSGEPTLGAILVNTTADCHIANVAVHANGSLGIILWNVTRTQIADSIFTDNRWAVLLVNSSGNTLEDNVVSGNTHGIGLGGPTGSSQNRLADNRVSDNTYGIDVVGSHNHLSSNTIVNNTYGVILDMAHDTLVIGNDITRNSGYGLYIIRKSSNNTVTENTIQLNPIGALLRRDVGESNRFYHNNFVNNTIQVLSFHTSSLWDADGAGNYWSDYHGADADGDGIGDAPYVTDATNQDRYPLMHPWARQSRPLWLQWWFLLLLTTGFPVAASLLYVLRKTRSRPRQPSAPTPLALLS